MNGLKFLPVGDSCMTIEFSKVISEEVNKKIRALSKMIKEANLGGVIETTPTFCSLTIYFNPFQISFCKLRRKILKLYKKAKIEKGEIKKVFLIPVCYEGEYAPDLDSVCELTGLDKQEVINIHTSTDYLIYMLGFLPGFPYLGGMSETLECKRLDTPRTQIIEGSVGIGGKQTGIYPLKSPGGWRIIGRTPVKLYDKFRNPPVLYKAGDYIRFFKITKEEFESGNFNEIKWEEVL